MALNPNELTDAMGKYIATLANASSVTTSASDRDVFEELLTHGRALGEMMLRGADTEALLLAVMKHQRIWNRMWLEDPVYESPWHQWRTIMKQVSDDAV